MAPTPTKTHRARLLRRNETDAEYRLWYELKARLLNGYKFVRQCPVGSYFADFLCRSHRLIVEVDGSQHAGNLRDIIRTRHLNAKGYSVLRFWNEEIQRECNAVFETILAAAEGHLTAASNGGPGFGLRFFPTSMIRNDHPPLPADTASSPLWGEGPGRGMGGVP